MAAGVKLVMSAKNRKYYVDLCYDALYVGTMQVTANTLLDACQLAMAYADDDCKWKDTFESSPHWIESIDGDPALVPEECSEAAIRAGGAVLIADRLREALKALIYACEQDHWAVKELGADVERAKAVLGAVPERISYW
jgi:hypothetical protein